MKSPESKVSFFVLSIFCLRHFNEHLPCNHYQFCRCLCFDLYDKLVPYKKAWSWQKSIVEEKKTLIDRNQDCADTVILLQHSPVYTMGTASTEDYLNFDIKDAPFDVYRTERGGEVTYHGPGQVIMSTMHWKFLCVF